MGHDGRHDLDHVDPYDVLGVSAGASRRDIVRAHRRAAGPVQVEPPAAPVRRRGSPPAPELHDPVVILGTRTDGFLDQGW